MKKSMEEILYSAPCFVGRASYYSGRGATLTDLNYKILHHIHAEIKKEHGEDAAKAMVKMVESMTNCNATDFISNCYQLEANGYQWKVKKARKNGVDVAKNSDGSHNMASALGTMAGLMFDSGRDETPQIRNQFLRENGIKIKGREIDIYGRFYIYN